MVDFRDIGTQISQILTDLMIVEIFVSNCCTISVSCNCVSKNWNADEADLGDLLLLVCFEYNCAYICMYAVITFVYYWHADFADSSRFTDRREFWI